MVYSSKNISISIEAPFDQVNKFLSFPQNFPKWAAGLSQTEIKKQGEMWLADSPIGTVKIKFTEFNKYGVIDHDVTLPNGEINHNPLRVLKNGDGSEVVFTLYRLPRMSDEDFNNDTKHVETDLKKLKSLFES